MSEISPPGGIALLALAIAYAFGTVNGAYYLVRLVSGRDVRRSGSGNAGARNAGRTLGSLGFAAVFTVDAFKGAAAMLVARLLDVDSWTLSGAAALVVAGHVWPVQLGFRGGRGIATSLGALSVLHPLSLAAGLVIALAALPMVRTLVVAGLLSYAIVPAMFIALDGIEFVTLALAAISAIVLFAHRATVAKFLRGDRRLTPGEETK